MSQTSKLISNLENVNVKSAFYLNTSTNLSSALLNEISTISFIVIKNDLFKNFKQQTLNPSSYLSSIVLKDSFNKEFPCIDELFL